VNGPDPAALGPAACRRAVAIVVAVLCLLLLAKTADGVASGTLGQVPFVAPLFVLPLLYVLPATRRWWTAHRWWLLAAQAVLTYVPFSVFGSNWVAGPSGLLAGLVLLTVAAPASWLVACTLVAVEVGVRAGLVGFPINDGAWPVVWILAAYVDNALTLFGLARLADMVARVEAARGEKAQVAVSQERLRAARALRSAVGERLTAVSTRAAAALHAAGRSPEQARELITEAGGLARQALADVRATTAVPDPVRPGEPAGPGTGAAIAPRLALTVLIVELCAFWAQTVNNVVGAHPALVRAGAVAAMGLAIVALQLYQSRPQPAGLRPRAWPWTMAGQALLVYGMLAVFWETLWGAGLAFAGFLAGSALLLIPGRRGQLGYGAVVASVPLLSAISPMAGLTLTPRQEIAAIIYFTAVTAGIGLLVYGLSWLAGLAVQLEGLRGELAAAAAAQERARVARDTHDLLGLGLSAAALKTDLIGRLIGRDDAAARAEIAELRRICAAAAADIRLVTGGQHLSPDAELTQARELLVSAGIKVRADFTGGPMPAQAEAVLAPVLREAVTNILRHSSARRCTIVTATGGGMLRLTVGNDGAYGPPAGDGGSGHGLANLTTRVEAAGGRLTSRRAGQWFELNAQIPLPAGQPGGEGGPAAAGPAREVPAT
jgi:two-component system, NarL family, sensor histidine kinase DesK